jgi:hypothetical protein
VVGIKEPASAANAILAVSLEMIEKVEDQLRREILDRKVRRRLAKPAFGERQKKPKTLTIGIEQAAATEVVGRKLR